MMMRLENINYKDQNSSIKDLIQQIKKGYQLQSLSIDEIENLSKEDVLNYIDSIILQPDYQREYRYSVTDESLLIESLLLEIPIPAIFLANDKYNGIQVLNVVDGQHRLTAFFRFWENKFALQELNLLSNYNKKNFSQLDLTAQAKLASSTIQQIIFKEFPGKDVELEIFNRYNKGTKPLTPQEIRNAIYSSKVNQYVNKFCSDIYINKKDKILERVYNMTEDRYLKKKIQESIFVILSILEHGIQTKHKKSPEYAESYMREKAEQEDCLKNQHQKIDELKIAQQNNENQIANLTDELSSDEINYKKAFTVLNKNFDEFNNFIKHISEKITYPFSREIYGVSSRNYKFQISIAMILAGIINKAFVANKTLKELKPIDDTLLYLKDVLQNSYLEDPKYNASSTNTIEIEKLINKVELDKIFK